jgi:carbonic anhydrase
VRALARVPTVSDAWNRGQSLTLHGWVYDLHDGLLRDRGVSTNGEAA